VHPFFFGCQYHPEFQSQPHRPSPPFFAFVLAASGQLDAHLPLPPLRTYTHRGPAAASAAATPARGGELAAATMSAAHASPAAAVSGAASSEMGGALPTAPIEKSPVRPVAVPQVQRVTAAAGGLQHPSSQPASA